MDDINNLIKTILPQILPVVSLLFGMWIQSTIDNKIDYIVTCYGALHTMDGLAIAEDIDSLIEGMGKGAKGD